MLKLYEMFLDMSCTEYQPHRAKNLENTEIFLSKPFM